MHQHPPHAPFCPNRATRSFQQRVVKGTNRIISSCDGFRARACKKLLKVTEGSFASIRSIVDAKTPGRDDSKTMRPVNVQYRILYRARSVVVGDWHCHAVQPGLGPHEAHATSDIVFVRRGMFRRHLGNSATTADPNTVLFFNPHEEYRVSHPSSAGDRCTVISVDDDALHELMEVLEVESDSESGRPFRVDHGYISTAVLLALRDVLARPQTDRLETDEILLTVIALALEVQRHRPARGPDDAVPVRRLAVERVREVAAARFRESLSLEQFSKETGYSPYHLIRAFRAETGMPIFRYINRLRLLHALDALETTPRLSGLALELGFCSHSHLTNAFVAEFGVAPDRVRRGLAPAPLADIRSRLRAVLRRPSFRSRGASPR